MDDANMSPHLPILAPPLPPLCVQVLSPLPSMLNLISEQFGVAQETLADAECWLQSAGGFFQFLGRLCALTRPLPHAFLTCFIAAVVVMFGQIIVSKYHIRYYTAFTYETKLRARRRASDPVHWRRSVGVALREPHASSKGARRPRDDDQEH
jgi:hypothetical protein